MISSVGERLLVRIVEKPKPQGILIIPDDKKEHQIGQVISLGPSLMMWEYDPGDCIEVGDYVYTRKYAGLLIEYDNIDYVSLEMKEILAVSKELK